MNNELRTYKHRRYNGSSKSWCRVPVMARSFGTPFFLHHKTQKSFYANFSRKNSKFRTRVGGKVFKRNFRSKYECKLFMKDLNKRFFSRYRKNVNFKLNLRGNKIIYYTGEKIG